MFFKQFKIKYCIGYMHFKQKKTYLAQNPSKTVSKAAVLLRYGIGPRRDFWFGLGFITAILSKFWNKNRTDPFAI
jgi:hypothetical protein